MHVCTGGGRGRGGGEQSGWRSLSTCGGALGSRLTRAVTIRIAERRCPFWLPVDSYVDSTVVNGSGHVCISGMHAVLVLCRALATFSWGWGLRYVA